MLSRVREGGVADLHPRAVEAPDVDVGEVGLDAPLGDHHGHPRVRVEVIGLRAVHVDEDHLCLKRREQVLEARVPVREEGHECGDAHQAEDVAVENHLGGGIHARATHACVSHTIHARATRQRVGDGGECDETMRASAENATRGRQHGASAGGVSMACPRAMPACQHGLPTWTTNMDCQHGLPTWTAGMDCRHGLPTWTAGMDCRHGLPAWTAGMDCQHRAATVAV